MELNKTVYVVTYSTESGDRGVLGVFKQKPKEADLKELTREGSDGWEVWEQAGEEGCGVFGSYYYLEVHECEMNE